jgi:protein O-GlcNAc transferase
VSEIDAVLERAAARLKQGADPEALAALEDWAARRPDHPGIALRHADALHLSGARPDALAEYRRAVALDAACLEGWWGLGCAALAERAFGEAASALEEAVRLRPDLPAFRMNLAAARFELGETDAALAGFRRVADAGDAALRRAALKAVACIIPGCSGADNQSILAARRAWSALEAAEVRPLPKRVPSPRPRLRIGYRSSFFAAANWMKPVWSVINNHDRSRFEIHLLSDGPRPTEASGYRGGADDMVHDVRGATNERLAEYVDGLALDILVELDCYSTQERLPLLFYRPAPAIVAWFGSYATTGIGAVDAIVADAAVLPQDEERFCSERVLRVPESYLNFTVGYAVPQVAPPPSLGGAPLTFGCFCSQYKLTDATLATWAAILAGAPGTRLLVKNRALGDRSTRDAFRARLGWHGIDPGRVGLEGPAEHVAFLERYAAVDIALDAFPYNGGTTTTEALWQGVLVLSFAGDRWAGRTSRSLLVAAGLADWCRADRASYIARAIELARAAGTPALLAELRATMRARLAAAPVCDGPRLCRALEAHYARLAAEGAPPAPG